MKKTKWILILLLMAFVIAVLCSGCAKSQDPAPGADFPGEVSEYAEDPIEVVVRAAFDDFIDQQFIDYVTDDTITLHFTLRHPENFGINRVEPTLGEFGSAAFAELEIQSREDLEALRNFPYSELSDDQKLIYDILVYYMELDIALFDQDLQYYISVLRPGTGMQAELPILLAEYKFYEESDVLDYLALLKDVDPFFRKAIKFEEERSKRGLFIADFAVDSIIEGCNDFTALRENNFLIEIFDEKIDELGLAEDKAAKYKEENKNTIINDVIPAYRTLVGGLENLKGTGVNDSGMCHFDQGKEYYEYLIKSQIGSDESVTSLADMIDERLEIVRYGMSYIIYNDESVLDLLKNPDFGSGDPEGIIEMIKYGMTDFYPENAGAAHTLKSLHPSLASSFPAAFYLSVPIDDFSSAVIYINDGSFSSDDLFPILAHEGYPGHLYQDTYFKSKKLHPLRYAMSSIGYIEGWATFAEINAYMFADFPEMGTELGILLGFDTEYKLALQSRCDIGVNYEGWTQKDLADYLWDFGIESRDAVRSIYEYVIKSPTRTLRYYVGYLEIENLLDYAHSELGDAFSHMGFNECILDIGPAPFFVVKKAVENYVTAAKEEAELLPAA